MATESLFETPSTDANGCDGGGRPGVCIDRLRRRKRRRIDPAHGERYAYDAASGRDQSGAGQSNSGPGGAERSRAGRCAVDLHRRCRRGGGRTKQARSHSQTQVAGRSSTERLLSGRLRLRGRPTAHEPDDANVYTSFNGSVPTASTWSNPYQFLNNLFASSFIHVTDQYTGTQGHYQTGNSAYLIQGGLLSGHPCSTTKFCRSFTARLRTSRRRAKPATNVSTTCSSRPASYVYLQPCRQRECYSPEIWQRSCSARTIRASTSRT